MYTRIYVYPYTGKHRRRSRFHGSLRVTAICAVVASKQGRPSETSTGESVASAQPGLLRRPESASNTRSKPAVTLIGQARLSYR